MKAIIHIILAKINQKTTKIHTHYLTKNAATHNTS